MRTARDDMVITPRLKRKDETSPRERAKEERRNEQEGLRRRRRRVRASRAERAARTRTRTRPSRGRVKVGVRNAARGATRVLGAAAVAAEALILTGQAFRQFEHGMSKRLVEAQDAHTIYGDLDEQFTASQNTRNFFESRPDLLRAIRNNGAMSAGMKQVSADMRRIELRHARGADLIERDPAFDSPDAFEDKVIKEIVEMAKASGLADYTREAIRLARKYIFWGF